MRHRCARRNSSLGVMEKTCGTDARGAILRQSVLGVWARACHRDQREARARDGRIPEARVASATSRETYAIASVNESQLQQSLA